MHSLNHGEEELDPGHANALVALGIDALQRAPSCELAEKIKNQQRRLAALVIRPWV